MAPARLLKAVPVAITALWLACAAAAYGEPSRGYELVSDAGNDVGEAGRMLAMSADGDTVAYMAGRGLADTTNIAIMASSVARRSAVGWASTDANLPSPRQTPGLSALAPVRFTSDFLRALFVTNLPIADGDLDAGQEDYYAADLVTRSTEWLTHGDLLPDTSVDSVLLLGASQDLSRIAFRSLHPLTAGAPATGLYLRGPEGLHLISVLPDGSPAAEPNATILQAQRYWPDFSASGGVAAPHGGQHAMSDDGTRLYWVNIAAGPGPLYLWDRDHSVLVSASQRSGSVGTAGIARFLGASHDGGVAYFASDDRLTDDAPPGGGIYRYRVETSELDMVLAAGDPAGLGLSSANVSDDQSHIYFVASAALTPDAVPGGSNAYVWAAGDGVDYIGQPGSGDFPRVTRDGRYAILRSSESIDGAPNNGKIALYEYAAATGQLACISCRPDGSPSQADANLDAQLPSAVPPQWTSPRNLTDDGRVFFASSDRIIPQDAGAGADIYLYDHGELSLITDGRSDYDSYMGDNTDDGHDVFFMTRERLASADDDQEGLDLYDARVGGGFPGDRPAPRCSEDECQGPSATPPSLPEPASTRGAGSGNVTPGPETLKGRRSVKLLKLSAAQRRLLARGGAARLTIRLTGGGTVVTRVKTRGDGTVIGSSRRHVRGTASTVVHLRLRLNAAGRRLVERRHRIKVVVEASAPGVRDVERLTLVRR